jgi:FKBP-type peptidyl-prolyl cis-trans isomerase 2
VCHLVSGAEFGWRNDTAMWPEYFEDSVAPVQTMQLLVTEVAEQTITVDGNHPLAGQDLTFDIELVEIDGASRIIV